MALHIQATEPGTAGPLFEDFLREQGTCEETTETAIKRVLAWQLQAAMKEQRISKVEMARRLATSRSQPTACSTPTTTP